MSDVLVLLFFIGGLVITFVKIANIMKQTKLYSRIFIFLTFGLSIFCWGMVFAFTMVDIGILASVFPTGIYTPMTIQWISNFTLGLSVVLTIVEIIMSFAIETDERTRKRYEPNPMARKI